MIDRVAFAGFAGAGKDVAAQVLIDRGYERVCFGDIIKDQLDEVVRRHFGFSAHTGNREEKARIRRTLESWGEDNYDQICQQFFDSLPPRAVNTRLVRVREGLQWVSSGGVIIEIVRPQVGAATQWEHDRFRELSEAGLIRAQIHNDGTPEQLHVDVLKALDELT